MTESTLVPLFIAGTFGMSVLIFVAGMSMLRSSDALARNRVRGLAGADSLYSAGLDLNIRRSGQRRLSWLTDQVGRGPNEQTRLLIQRSGLPLRVGEYISLRLLAMFLGAAVLGLFGTASSGQAAGLVMALLGFAVGFITPPLLLRFLASRRERAIEGQLVELCELMASMMRSGYGYVQALSSTANEIGDPLRSELTRLVDAVRLGGDVDDELQELNARLGSKDFDMIATAISIQRRSGGNLSEILEGVAQTIRYRLSFKRDLDALTSRERFSAVIVAVIPVLIVGALTLMDPERYLLLFTDPLGRIALGVSIFLDITGYLVIKRVSRVEV